MKRARYTLALLFGLTSVIALAETLTLDFNKDKIGMPPAGFSQALTGKGKPGTWVVIKDEADPGSGNVLAQTDMDSTSYRFPLCILDCVTAADVDLQVRFKPVKGQVDQAAGLVWRYKDQDNYYIVRANALENNVVLYKVENGKRTDLPLKGEGRTYGKKTKVPSGQWSMLRVLVHGDVFEVYLNDQKLFEVQDATFKQAGKVGLWTKADSLTYFDELHVTTK